MSQRRILVIAGDPIREWLDIILSERQFEVHSVSDGYNGIELFRKQRADLVIADLTLAELDGLSVLQTVKETDPRIPVIIITDGEELDVVIEAMRRGAHDCVDKPVDLYRLQQIIAGALNLDCVSLQNGDCKPVRPGHADLTQVVVGRSEGMKDVLGKIRSASSGNNNLVIEGEYGTGKRLVSRAIHNSGATYGHPFVAVDLNSLPEPLLDTVLFGQVGGKQPGKAKGRKGLFELAGEGTIFLSEISGISKSIQEKLLRVLQKKEFRPVGGETGIPVKARIIGATNRNLRELVRAGTFREDLFYRLAVCSITLPPLRDRKEDIPSLVVHFLRKANRRLQRNVKRIPGETIEALKSREWPGNVAELEGVVIRAIVSARSDVLEMEYLTARGDGKQVQANTVESLSLDAIRKEHIKSVLDETNWDRKEAARLLNISRQALYNKIKKYGIVRF